MFRPDNVSEVRWSFYKKLFFFALAGVLLFFAAAAYDTMLLTIFAIPYIPCALGYVLFHTYFAIQAEKNAPPQEIPAETEEKE